MKFLDATKRTVALTGIIYTVISLLANLLLSAMGEAAKASITVGLLWILFLFSAVCATAALIFKAEKLHIAARIAINFVVCYAAMYLCFFVLFYNTREGMKQNGNPYTPGQILVVSVLFAVVYAIIIAIKLIIDAKKKKKAKTVPYKKQFKGM